MATALYLSFLFHLIGDYITQSDWMANRKTKEHLPALIHSVLYSLPFLLIVDLVWWAYLVLLTHFVIDRYRLAVYICYVKNFMAPKSEWHSFEECKGTGYLYDKPMYMSVWLMIIADNTLHLGINGLAVYLSYN